MSKEINQFDQDNRRHGWWEIDGYYRNRHSWRSASKAFGNYVNGRREGLWKYLAEDNSLVFKVYFINDEEKQFVGYNLSHKIHRKVIFI